MTPFLRNGRILAVSLASILALSCLTACGSDDDGGGSEETVTLRVFAAASLTEAFTELGKQFEEDHPGTKVEFNFGPSSGLAEQIGSGAPGRRLRLGQPEQHGHARQRR